MTITKKIALVRKFVLLSILFHGNLTDGEPCIDSTTNAAAGGGDKGCPFIADNQQYCDTVDGIPSHCPFTCDACDSYTCEDSLLRFEYDSQVLYCTALSKIDEVLKAKYCAIEDILSTCRASCGYCATTSPTFSPVFCNNNDVPIRDGTAFIPESWDAIPEETFANCNELKRLEIPAKIKEIGKKAFYESGLTEVNFEVGSLLEKIGDYGFSYTNLVSIIIPKSVTELCYSAFRYMKGPVEFESDSSIKFIGDYAFSGATFVSITFPKSVIELGIAVFYVNEELTTVEFESETSLEKIGFGAFKFSGLKSINLPLCVEIGEEAFYAAGCPESAFVKGSRVVDCVVVPNPSPITPSFSPTACPTLSPTTVPTPSPTTTTQFCNNNNVPIIDGTGFIPETWDTIPKSSFEDCTPLKRLEISARIMEVGDYAFKNSGLEEVIFESGSILQEIGKEAFYFTNLVSVLIPRSVKELGDSAFHQARSLSSVEFEGGSTLELIGQEAFKVTNITGIVIPTTVTELGWSAFTSTPLVEIFIPKSVAKFRDYVFYNTDIVTAEFESGSPLTYIGRYGFKKSKIENINLPVNVSFDGSVFKETPCPDKDVFKENAATAGSRVVNCVLVTV